MTRTTLFPTAANDKIKRRQNCELPLHCSFVQLYRRRLKAARMRTARSRLELRPMYLLNKDRKIGTLLKQRIFATVRLQRRIAEEMQYRNKSMWLGRKNSIKTTRGEQKLHMATNIERKSPLIKLLLKFSS